MFVSRAIGITFIIVLLSLCVPAQTPPQANPNPENPGPPRTGSITGQVVDENEQPLPNAVVQIRAINSNTAQTVNTDREGQFQVNNLEPVDYSVSASKPAYLTGKRTALRPSNTFRIGDRVALSLVKGGVITGKVMDAK
ncbi:MAG TPA: carboxypeptidase-like regulatory domain-containing protein, partial [Pyrinomonadaceae bacterium]|nr:carboxypeptidase-like regulatory domain-containing protein [Pyrinomonadaceae bacterium]